MNFKAVLLICILWRGIVVSQEIEILRIDTEHYPEITAHFKVTDAKGEIVFDLKKEQAAISENNTPCEITYFRPPKQIAEPMSVVLVFDISGSMNKNRLKIVTSAAHTFIDNSDLSFTRIAILAFSDNVEVVSDYSQNKVVLNKALKGLKPHGGTNYNNAFLTPEIGALNVLNTKEKNKYLVFLTDGTANANADSIVQIANKQNVNIYTLTVDLKVPYVLEEITQRTDGYYLGSVRSTAEATTFYSQLAREIKSTEYGTIRWKADRSCSKTQHTKLSLNNYKVDFQYPVDVSSVPFFYAPDYVIFQNHDANNYMANLKLRAINSWLDLDTLFYDKSEVHPQQSIPFPLRIQSNSSYTLKLNYPYGEQGIVNDKLTVLSRNCDTIQVPVVAGGRPTLVLETPQKGDVYIQGTNIPVTWTGVSEKENIEVYIKTKKTDWTQIGVGSHNIYNWQAKVDTGKYKVLIQPLDKIDLKQRVMAETKLYNPHQVVFDNTGDFFFVRNDVGNMIMYATADLKRLRSMNIRTSPILYDSEGMALVSSSQGGLTRYPINARSEHFETSKEKLVQSFLRDDGKELYSPLYVSRSVGKTSVYSPLFNKQVTLMSLKPNKSVCISLDGKKAFVQTDERIIQEWDDEQMQFVGLHPISSQLMRGIIAPNSEYGVFIYANEVKLYSFKSFKTIESFRNYTYKQFSPGAKFVLLENKSQISIYSISEKQVIYKTNKAKQVHFTNSPNYMYIEGSDSLKMLDLQKKKILHSVVLPEGCHSNFNIKNRWFTISHAGFVHLFNEKGLQISSIDGRLTQIDKAFVVPYEKELITLDKKGRIALWLNNTAGNSDTSGWFSIINANPIVKDTLHLGACVIGRSKEVLFNEVFVNSSYANIIINSISIGNKEFKLVSGEADTLKPTEVMNLELRFAPKQIQQRKAWLTIKTNAGIYRVLLLGKGLERPKFLQSEIVDLGKVNINDTLVSNHWVISNKYKVNWAIDSIVQTGKDHFSLLEKTNRLLAGDSLVLPFAFHPKQRGRITGALYFYLQNYPHVIKVPVWGRGQAQETIKVQGVVLNEADSMPLQAEVNCVDIMNNRLVVRQNSTENGTFSFNISTDRQFVVSARKSQYISSSVNITLQQPVFDTVVNVTIWMNQLRSGESIRLNGVFFDFDKASLRSESFADLNRVIKILEKNPEVKIEIQGHTDDKGSHAYNQSLSSKRATSVKQYFISKGINANRLTSAGYGETKPIAPNNSDENRQLNRRVEAKIR